MMTPEERAQKERELKAIELEMVQAEIQLLESRLAGMEPEREKVSATDARGMGTALTQGATFGWGDEITAAATAGMAKLAGDEKPFGEIYRDVKGAEKARQDQYVEDNPGVALGLEFAGGMAVPGRFLMGGKIPGPVKNSRLWRSHKARKATRRAEETALGGTRRRVFRNTGRGASTGAFAGAGYAEDTEDMPASIAQGAAFGAALPLAMSTGRNIGRFVTRRRVEPELGRGADFRPIHLAADKKANTAADLYRNWVGKAFGGRKIMAEQEARYVGKMKDAKRTAQLQLDSDRAAAKMAKRASAAAKEASPQQALLLRKMAANEALPGDAPPQVRQQVLDLIDRNEMGRAAQALDKWWADDGFRMVKERVFKWDGSPLFKNLDDMVRDNPELALDLAGTIERVPMLAETLQKMATKGDPIDVISTLFRGKRDISGDAMMAIRNVFAKAANRGGPKAGAMRAVANQFDEAIRKGLGKGSPEAARFNEHITRYGTKQTFGDAVLAAQNRKAGVFEPDDWLSAISGGSKKTYGQGPLQRTAQAIQKRAGSARESAKKAVQQTEDDVRRSTIGLRDAGDALTTIEGRALPKDVALHQQILATQILGSPGWALGSPAGFLGSAGGGHLSGMLHSSLLASPAVQRAVAGQTGWQKGAQSAEEWLMQQRLLQELLRGGVSRARSSAVRQLAKDEDED